ncbi:MAG: hypothetical protein ABSC34_01610 [Acidimicrobiales bacterium]
MMTLSAVLVANLALIGIFTPSVGSASGLKEIYGFSCCSGGFGTVNYHPGETLHVDWISTALRSSAAAAVTVVLSANASGPFPSIAAAKKALASSQKDVGRTIFSAPSLHVSDQKPEKPVSLLHVPPSAGTGFYELTLEVVKGENSKHFGLIFTIKS